jgi:hypothetical protein
MKKYRLHPLWLKTLIPAFCLMVVAGCASSRGYNQADETGATIGTVRTDVANIKTAIDGSLKSLDEVVAAASTDPRKPYETFAKSVDTVEAAGNTAKKDADKMRTRAASYFSQWDAQMESVKNEDVKKLSQERKAKLQESFNSIKDATEDVKQSFPGFLSDLKDLRTALGSDLTAQGIDAAKGVIEKTKTSGAQVQQDLDKLITEMNSVAAAFTAAKVPTKKAAPVTSPSHS